VTAFKTAMLTTDLEVGEPLINTKTKRILNGKGHKHNRGNLQPAERHDPYWGLKCRVENNQPLQQMCLCHISHKDKTLLTDFQDRSVLWNKTFYKYLAEIFEKRQFFLRHTTIVISTFEECLSRLLLPLWKKSIMWPIWKYALQLKILIIPYKIVRALMEWNLVQEDYRHWKRS